MIYLKHLRPRSLKTLTDIYNTTINTYNLEKCENYTYHHIGTSYRPITLLPSIVKTLVKSPFNKLQITPLCQNTNIVLDDTDPPPQHYTT